jgi:hypothetical protein
MLSREFEKQGDMPLVRPAEQKSDMILDQEAAAGANLAIG